MENKLSSDLAHIVKYTNSLWGEMRGKTLFITGGTGFFGKWLLESFAYANRELSLEAKLIVLSRNPEAFLALNPQFNNPTISFLKGDIRSFVFPEEVPLDYIIHAATEASVSLNLEAPLLMFDTIVEGTKRVLELARVKNISAILHTSSGAVYGKQPSEMTHVDEEYNGCPDSYSKDAAYGEGKRVAEMLCAIYHKNYGVNSKIARCYAFVGPYLPLDGHFAIGNFINDVLNKRDLLINGDGTPYRSYLYASDLVIWLWTILVKGESGVPYNVGSDIELTIAELARKIVKENNANVKIRILQPEVENAKVSRYVPNVNRAKKLGLAIHIDLTLAIEKTMKFYSV